MMRKVKMILIGCIVATLVARHTTAQEQTSKISSQVDALLEDAVNKNLFSGLVVISKGGQTVYFKQLGYADWQTKRAFTKNTLFNIGSLNKQFTEELIHQLAKEGKLNYTDNLSRYLNLYSPEIGNKITIQHLLDMTAGLGDYLMNPKFRTIQNKDFSLNELIEIIKDEPLRYEPGQGKAYSNSGYAVLGAVIEKITGKSYEENLRERIAKPLGLNNIYYSKAEKEKQQDRATGTRIDFDGNKNSMDDYSASTPAGGIYTTAEDLLKFTEAKRTGSLPSGKKYGTGSFAGGTPLWNSTITYNEKTGFSVVVMANIGKIADDLTPRIGSILKGEPYPPLEPPFEKTLYQWITEKGEAYVRDHVQQLAQQARLPYDDRFLNFFGYQMLQANKLDAALKLFRINTELFPKVPNTFDSLAEAYALTGDKENAIKNYKKVLNLDPNNTRVQNTLRELEHKN